MEKTKKLAKKIWEIEQKDLSEGKKLQEMMSIAKDLDFQELLKIDEYIMNNLANSDIT